MDLNVKHKNTKFLKDVYRKSLVTLGLIMMFFINTTPKAKAPFEENILKN